MINSTVKAKIGQHIIVLYLMVLMSSIILGGFGRFNTVPLLLYIIMYNYCCDNKGLIMSSCIFMFPVILFSLINKCSYLHLSLDIISFIFIYSSVYNIKYMSLDDIVCKRLFKIILILILFSILGIFSGHFRSTIEGSNRYSGFFSSSGNTSACIFCILGIIAWELQKKYYIFKNRKIVLWYLIVTYLIYVYQSETRSLLFALPYWLYQCTQVFSKKFLLVLVLLILFFTSKSLLDNLSEKTRMEEDASYNTRMYLYLLIIDGIKENWYLIPHGSHTAWDLVRLDVEAEDMSTHNDFLRYIYDWGISFYLLLYFMWKSIYKNVSVNLNVLLVLLFASSFALHNVLFNALTWMPVVILLIINKKDDNYCQRL